MSKLKKLKKIDTFKPRLETIYETQNEQREQAIEVAKNCPDEIKNKNIRYLLKN